MQFVLGMMVISKYKLEAAETAQHLRALIALVKAQGLQESVTVPGDKMPSFSISVQCSHLMHTGRWTLIYIKQP